MTDRTDARAMMRAVRLHKQAPHLRLDEVPVPEPGAHEVLVRVEAAGVCHSDLFLLDHAGHDPRIRLPVTLGHEIAGRVEAFGRDVDGLVVGSPVAVLCVSGCRNCRWCESGDQELCDRAVIAGATRDGGFAEFILVPRPDRLIPLGELDPISAAPLTDAALTPYRALRRVESLLGVGTPVVVIGVGGLGQFAVQLARTLYGADVIAVDVRPERLARALELGAAHVIEAGRSAAVEVLNLTHGRGAPAVLDFVGNDQTLALGARIVSTRGTLVLIGIDEGSLPLGFRSLAPEASVTALLSGGNADYLAEVVRLAQIGQIDCDVTIYPLEAYANAFDDLRAGRIAGRAVLTPTTTAES